MEDYKFGTKNQWRRWIWNRIEDRVDVPKKEAVCIYLPGPNDLDRVEAKRRGFRDHNLIGVEREKKTLVSLRDRDVLVVDGDFLDVTLAVQKNNRVDVVFGDYMHGLEKSIFNRTVNMMFLPNLRQAVFAFNFLRGRDSSTNEMRENSGQWIDIFYPQMSGTKHRGLHLFAWLISEFIPVFTDEMQSSFQDRERMMHRFLSGLTPAFQTYKSGPQFFDSVVFQNPVLSILGLVRNEDQDLIAFNNVAEFHDLKRETVRKSAAVLAHRTMRIKALQRDAA
jgi:hypothetical protein